jgi:thiol-disulfide isomerase/thioredoxin
VIQIIVALQVVFGFAIALNLLLTFALIRTTNKRTGGLVNSDAVGLKVGDSVPQFNGRTLDGQEVANTTYAHGRVAFLFVSPTCKPCVEQMPQYLQLAARARDHGDELVLVTGGDVDSTRRVLPAGRSTVVLLGRGGQDDLFERFRVRGTPFLTLVNEGKVLGSDVPSDHSPVWTEIVQAWQAATTEGNFAFGAITSS